MITALPDLSCKCFNPRGKALKRTARATLAATALALLAACGGGAENAGDDAINIIGSSTVYPFAQKIAQDFVAENEGMAMPLIESTGTSDGIEIFCSGQGPDKADIVNASRRMTLAEFERCTANGVTEIVEIKVGRDGIAFASAIEDGIELELTPDVIYRAIAANPLGKEQAAQNWSDVDSALPNEPIIVYGPPRTSGTRDAMQELVLEAACNADSSMAALKDSDPSAYQRSCLALRSDSSYLDQGEQDDLIVRKVANNPRAIGVFGFSYLEENAGSVKALPINGVLPTAQTIADGSYPVSRPLYIYVKKAHIGVTPGLEEFLAQWSKSWSAGGPLVGIGLVPASDDQQRASAAAIQNLTVLTAADFAADGA